MDARSVDLVAMVALVTAAGKPPALSNATPARHRDAGGLDGDQYADTFSSATAAHQFVRYNAGVAQASADAAAPLNLAGV